MGCGASNATISSTEASSSPTAVDSAQPVGEEEAAGQQMFTLEDVQKHATGESCYTAIRGVIYDLTPFIAKHPGRATAIVRLCGTDGTEAFAARHGGQERPEAELAGLEIGVLE